MEAISALQHRFESRLPEIQRLVASRFPGLDAEARQEAVQNTVVLCWRYFLRLAEQGKHEREDVLRSMIWWAARHTRQGRQGGGRGKAKPKCALDYGRRRHGGVTVQDGLDFNHYVGSQAAVPEVVAFRLDTSAFLATLSERNRGIAVDLAWGMTTTEAAKTWGVTPGAISQFRERFRRWYDAFHAGTAN
jgi:hypothetical protein